MIHSLAAVGTGFDVGSTTTLVDLARTHLSTPRIIPYLCTKLEALLDTKLSALSLSNCFAFPARMTAPVKYYPTRDRCDRLPVRSRQGPLSCSPHSFSESSLYTLVLPVDTRVENVCHNC